MGRKRKFEKLSSLADDAATQFKKHCRTFTFMSKQPLICISEPKRKKPENAAVYNLLQLAHVFEWKSHVFFGEQNFYLNGILKF